jgi:hypothetical protein
MFAQFNKPKRNKGRDMERKKKGRQKLRAENNAASNFTNCFLSGFQICPPKQIKVDRQANK